MFAPHRAPPHLPDVLDPVNSMRCSTYTAASLFAILYGFIVCYPFRCEGVGQRMVVTRAKSWAATLADSVAMTLAEPVAVTLAES